MPWPKLPVPQHPIPASEIHSFSPKVENMKALSQMYSLKFQMSMAEGTEAVLIHVLHELFLYEAVKIAYCCSPPFSLISQTEVQYTKFKTEWGAHGCGLSSRNPGRRVKKKGNQSSWLCNIMIFLWHGNVRCSSFQEFQRLCFQVLVFQRNIISIKIYLCIS